MTPPKTALNLPLTVEDAGDCILIMEPNAAFPKEIECFAEVTDCDIERIREVCRLVNLAARIEGENAKLRGALRDLIASRETSKRGWIVSDASMDAAWVLLMNKEETIAALSGGAI